MKNTRHIANGSDEPDPSHLAITASIFDMNRNHSGTSEWLPAKTAELVKKHEITPGKTLQTIEKAPVSARERCQGQER